LFIRCDRTLDYLPDIDREYNRPPFTYKVDKWAGETCGIGQNQMSLMLQEIAEQPAALEKTIAEERRKVEQLARHSPGER
jgi:hypothetical protein